MVAGVSPPPKRSHGGNLCPAQISQAKLPIPLIISTGRNVLQTKRILIVKLPFFKGQMSTGLRSVLFTNCD